MIPQPMTPALTPPALTPSALTPVLTLVGGPTVLIDLGGLRLLTDPTFDPPGTYGSGSVPLVKTAGPALPVEDLGRIDAVLLSHDQHADNLDTAGRALLPCAGRILTTPVGALRLSQENPGLDVLGLAPWQTVCLPFAHPDQSCPSPAPSGQLLVTGTPARHGPAGIEPVTGEVTGFLLGLEAPGDLLYFSGDTVWYEGVAEVARRYRPRLVILNAGSAEPRGKFHLTMDNNDAIDAAHAFGEAQIVAIHNEGWEHFRESQADLEAAFAALGLGNRLVTLMPGQPVPVPLPSSSR